eukprot:1915351-Amphidinium_carterae.1
MRLHIKLFDGYAISTRKIKLTLRVAEQSRRSDRPRGEAVLHIDLDRRMPAGCLLRSSTLEDVGALITVEIKDPAMKTQ